MEERPADRLYSVPQIRAMLGGLGRTSVFKLFKNGRLERWKIGRNTYTTPESMTRFVDSLTPTDVERGGPVEDAESD